MIKIKEANRNLDVNNVSVEGIAKAKEKLAEGMDIINHRQKIIKIADSSELGWRVVQEYEANPLADDSDDEKKLFKAETRAERKMKAAKTKKAKMSRTHPYAQPEAEKSSQFKRPGRCFNCGVKGHWKQDCPEAVKSNEKISIDYVQCRMASEGQNIVTPVNSLRNHIKSWQEVNANDYILSVIDQGYKLPFKTFPVDVFLDNNKSAKDNAAFVRDEINKLLLKGCISQVPNKPRVVNPLTVAGNKTKLRLVLDCRHINPHLYVSI